MPHKTCKIVSIVWRFVPILSCLKRLPLQWLALSLACLATPAEEIARAQSEQPADANTFSGERAELNLDEVSFGFGTIYRGQKVSHSFQFSNSGRGLLEIRSIHASCGCINVRVEPKTRFLPGEKGKIALEFDSAMFSGSLMRILTVDSNDALSPTKILTISAKIEEEISANPSIVSLGEVDTTPPQDYVIGLSIFSKAKGTDTAVSAQSLSKLTDETIKKRLQADAAASGDGNAQAASANQSKIEILGITASNNAMLAKIEDDPKKGKVVRIKFSTLPPGPFRERITIWNTSRHLKELVVPVIAEVVGHVTIATNSAADYLEFGAVGPGAVAERSLDLSSTASSFAVEGVSIELRKTPILEKIKVNDVFSNTVQKVTGGATVKFSMRVPQGLSFATPSINISGTAVVKTNDPGYKEIRVPIFGVLKQEAVQ